MSARPLALALALLPAAGLAAGDPPPAFGRYMPMYPGLYFSGGYGEDDRDATYDRHGESRPTAAPQAGGRTAFPERSLMGSFTWHFPMFESQHLPFFSARTHLARVILRHVDTTTRGELAAFVADPSDDARSEADDLVNSGYGIGDATFQFGSFLYGSPAPGWRARERSPFAVLALVSVNVPTGVYERDAPNNAGSNTWHFEGRLGVHWRPWSGGFLDVGAGYRDYLVNEEPQFGRLAPHRQGDEVLIDVSLAQRLRPGLYATTYIADRAGEPNQYDSPVYAPNAPPHPDSNTDTFPTPGTYRDGGTERRVQGFTLQYFVTQRWLAALHFEHPRQGRSGQFLLPFSEKTPSGCTPGSTNCTVSPGQTVLVDGMGPARAYSSDRTVLTLTYQFGPGDPFACTGCVQ